MPYIGISYRIPWYHKWRHCHFILTAITFRMVKNLGLPILGKLVCSWRKVDTRVFYLQPKTIIMTFVLLWYYIVMCWTVAGAVKTFKAMESSAIKSFWNLCQNRLLNARECLGNISFCQKFLTRNSLFLLETHFSYSKLAFLTRNSLFLLETHFSYSKLTFLTRNSLFQGTLYLAAFISRWISKTLLNLLQANFQDPS